MVLPVGARTLGASARMAVAMDAGHASRAARFYSMILDVSDEAVLEQLELSRRYWEVEGVSDWKIILVEGAVGHVS